MSVETVKVGQCLIVKCFPLSLGAPHTQKNYDFFYDLDFPSLMAIRSGC